jgi:hypothetical protein
MERRDFLGSLLAAGLTASLAEGTADAQSPEGDGPGGNAAAFWSGYFAPQAGAGAATRALFGGAHARAGVTGDRQCNFLNYDTRKQILRFPQEVAAGELPDYPGDVALQLSVGGIRLSQADRARVRDLRSAQVRVDLAQNQKLEHFDDFLAWASIASLFVGEAKALPALQDLSLSPESTKQVLLPGGAGSLGLNVSMAHQRSSFFLLLQRLVGVTGALAPALSLPAISLTAIAGVYKALGMLENSSTFLFQTAAPQPILTTQAAAQRHDANMRGFNVISGDYVAVPQAHITAVQSYLDAYRLEQGYLIPKTANTKSQSIYTLAESAPPDISYITLNLRVTPLVQMGAVAPGLATAPKAGAAKKKVASGGRGSKAAGKGGGATR